MRICDILLIHLNNSRYFFIPDLLDHNSIWVNFADYIICIDDINLLIERPKAWTTKMGSPICYESH